MYINYYGTENFQEYPVTGRLVLWRTGSKENVPTDIANILKTYPGFQLETDGTGEYATWATDASGSVTGLVGPDVNMSLYSAAKLLPSISEIGWPLTTGHTDAPFYTCYVDPVNGNDGWDGSAGEYVSGSTGPKRTIDTAAWTGTKTSLFADEQVLFRAGTTYTHQSTSAAITVTSNRKFGAYWLPADDPAALPTIRSLNTAGGTSGAAAVFAGSGTLTNITFCDLIINMSDVPNRHGISLYQWADNQALTNLTIKNVHVVGGTVNNATWYAGISISYKNNYTRTTAPAETKNILIQDCSVTGVGAMGFATALYSSPNSDGNWYGTIDFVNCVADGCGSGIDSHGFTSFGIGIKKDWTYGSWTLASGTIYYRDISVLYGYSVWDIDSCRVADPNGEMFSLVQNKATPTTPAIGEFGFDAATQRLYVNMNAAITSSFIFTCSVHGIKGIRYIGCEAKNTLRPGVSGTTEGIGFAFDDLTSHCGMYGCASHHNAGIGASMNQGFKNVMQDCRIYDNTLAALVIIFGYGHTIRRCYIDSKYGTEQFSGAGKGGIGLFATSTKSNSLRTTMGVRIYDSVLKYSGSVATDAVIATANSTSAPRTVVDGCVLTGSTRLDNGRTLSLINRRQSTDGIPVISV